MGIVNRMLYKCDVCGKERTKRQAYKEYWKIDGYRALCCQHRHHAETTHATGTTENKGMKRPM